MLIRRPPFALTATTPPVITHVATVTNTTTVTDAFAVPVVSVVAPAVVSLSVIVVKKEVSTQTDCIGNHVVVSGAVAAAMIAGSANTTTAVPTVATVVTASSQWNDQLEEMNGLYCRYVLEMLECYDKSFFEFSQMELYFQTNASKLMKVRWIYDNDFDYKSVVPLNYWRRLNASEKVRLCFRRYSDYDNIYFRFLAFVLNGDALNVDDLFVLFDRATTDTSRVDRIVEIFVKHDRDTRLLQGIANILSVDYMQLILKCQTFKDFLNSTRGVFHI